MFSRIARAVKAVAEEVFAPSRPPLEEFKQAWAHVTDLVMLIEDRDLVIESTEIPFHLSIMVETLKKEEEQGDSTGPVMEHMLRTNLLKTAVSLGQADYPAGMMKSILRFSTELLASLSQPLIPHVAVHGPLQRLVVCSLQRRAGKEGPEDLELVNFLCAICGKLVEDPSLATFFLKSDPLPGQTQAPPFALPGALCALALSSDPVVATRAREGLLVCMTLQPPHVAEAIVCDTDVCDRMGAELGRRLQALPGQTREASPSLLRLVDIWMCERGARQGPEQCSAASPDDVQRWLEIMSWLQLCDEIATRANALVASSLAMAISARLLREVCAPRLALPAEASITMVTNYLTACITQLTAPSLLLAFVRFFVEGDEGAQMQRLLGRCDDMSDEVSLASLRLVAAMLHTRSELVHVALLLVRLAPTERAQPALDQAAASLSADQLLNLVPTELQSGEASACRTYIAGAHNEMREWVRACRRWAPTHADSLPDPAHALTWPPAIAPEPSSPVASAPVFLCTCDAPLVAVVMRRLRRLCEQPYAINLVITSIVASIFSVPNKSLHAFLLHDRPDGLLSVLALVGQEVQARAARVTDVLGQLRAVRAELENTGEGMRPTPLMRFLRAVVLLEEFSKELASIAVVWANPTLLSDL